MKNRKAWGLVAVLSVVLCVSLAFTYDRRIGDWQWAVRPMLPDGARFAFYTMTDTDRPAQFHTSWVMVCGLFRIGVVHWVPRNALTPRTPR
jgi:hypothetical protein